jgi:hypothetical protein
MNPYSLQGLLWAVDAALPTLEQASPHLATRLQLAAGTARDMSQPSDGAARAIKAMIRDAMEFEAGRDGHLFEAGTHAVDAATERLLAKVDECFADLDKRFAEVIAKPEPQRRRRKGGTDAA